MVCWVGLDQALKRRALQTHVAAQCHCGRLHPLVKVGPPGRNAPLRTAGAACVESSPAVWGSPKQAASWARARCGTPAGGRDLTSLHTGCRVQGYLGTGTFASAQPRPQPHTDRSKPQTVG